MITPNKWSQVANLTKWNTHKSFLCVVSIEKDRKNTRNGSNSQTIAHLNESFEKKIAILLLRMGQNKIVTNM